MTVYNINLGIGWASSGVEYAQIYRAKILRNINQEAKFIFTDLILNENIEHFTKNIGFKDEEIIWLYNYFTDMKICPTTFTITDLEKTLDLEIIKVEKYENKIRYYYTDDKMMTAYLVNDNNLLVNRVEYVSKGNLVRKDYFTNKKFLTEYYAPKNNAATLYQRRFFNSDGTIAYEEVIDGNNSIYKFSDNIFYSKEEFIAYFIKKLELTASDIVILDRATGVGQAVLKNAKPAKLGVVIHAEHFNEHSTDNYNILWNNYYEYTFSNAEKVDFFITSTKLQEDILQRQFYHYYNIKPKIYTVPVGSVSELKFPSDNRKIYSLMTASRLASEKNINLLIEAVVLAKREIPELIFDIYGAGGEEGRLRELIEKLHAKNYIKLCGHKNLENIYCNYEVYLSASMSEGFGLTLLEAMSSGQIMIGFDVRYGNPTFIKNDINGYLISKISEDSNILIKELAAKIVKLYKENDLRKMHKESYKLAKLFLTSEIELAWSNIIKEQIKDD